MPIHRVLHAQRTYGFTLRLYAVIKPGTDARSCHEFNALQSNVHIQYRSSHGPFSKWAFYAADSHVLTDYDFVFFFEASMDLENFQWAEFWRRYAVYSSLWSNLPVIGALRQASPYFPLRPDWWQACGRGDIPFLNVDFVEQSFAMLNSSFAVWYLQRLVKIGLISEQTRLGLDWGVDAAWCAAAAEWAGKDAGCLLVLLEMQQFDVERSRRVLGTGEQLVNLWWSRLSVWMKTSEIWMGPLFQDPAFSCSPCGIDERYHIRTTLRSDVPLVPTGSVVAQDAWRMAPWVQA